MLQHEGVKTSNRYPCSLPQWGRAGPLNGVSAGAGADRWVGPEWIRWSAHPLGGAVCRDHARYPAFAPGTWEVAAGFWPFCILFILCPSRACVQLFLVPYSFFIFHCSRRYLSRRKHCSNGSQVPTCLTWATLPWGDPVSEWQPCCSWGCLRSYSYTALVLVVPHRPQESLRDLSWEN